MGIIKKIKQNIELNQYLKEYGIYSPTQKTYIDKGKEEGLNVSSYDDPDKFSGLQMEIYYTILSKGMEELIPQNFDSFSDHKLLNIRHLIHNTSVPYETLKKYIEDSNYIEYHYYEDNNIDFEEKKARYEIVKEQAMKPENQKDIRLNINIPYYCSDGTPDYMPDIFATPACVSMQRLDDNLNIQYWDAVDDYRHICYYEPQTFNETDELEM